MPGRGGRGLEARFYRSPPKYLNNSPPELPHSWNCSNNPYHILDSPPPPPKIKKKTKNIFEHSKHHFPPSPPPPPKAINGQPDNVPQTDQQLEKYFSDDITQLTSSMSNLDTPKNIKT